MITVTFEQVTFGVAPGPDEAKALHIIHQPSETAYVLPLQSEAVKTLLEDLGMTNEELQAKIDRQKAQAKIEIAKSVPDIGNGKG